MKYSIIKKLSSLFSSPIGLKKYIEETNAEQKEIKIQLHETFPLEYGLVLGPIFPSKKSYRRIISLVEFLRRGIIKGGACTETFHLKNGLCFDLKISAPYLLRQYKEGVIVKIEPPKENEATFIYDLDLRNKK